VLERGVTIDIWQGGATEMGEQEANGASVGKQGLQGKGCVF
jgi:hypothetical protein